MRGELPTSETILQTLHNLCAIAAELARKSEELAQVLHIQISEIERVLDNYRIEGLVESFMDPEGKKRYYLTGRGIIRVCALFT